MLFNKFLGVALLILLGVGIWQFGWVAAWVITFVTLREYTYGSLGG